MCWEIYGRKEGVLKGWEVAENYATMLNVSQSNKGYRVETKKKRGGAGNARYEILELSNSPSRVLLCPCSDEPQQGRNSCHGCLCPGDMAVHMDEVLVRRWVGVCVPLNVFLTGCELTFPTFPYKMIINYFGVDINK